MTLHWQPTAPLPHLRLRADILQQIRHFFKIRQVLEVETPLMCHTSVTDPFIQSIPALFQSHPNHDPTPYYLQTSPEFAMKRLLAAGSGSIFQLCKAFRQGEVGHLHNPEFTLLEWYRLGFSHHDLMNEMDELLQLILHTEKADRITYADLFRTHLQIDAHQASLAALSTCANQRQIAVASTITDRDTWLNLLMTHCIEPVLGQDRPCFIYDFPASQAALAKLLPGDPRLAARFEVYVKGIELANGFHELQDALEQRRRFEQNQHMRQEMGLPDIPIDQPFLAALAHGLPDCAGVALGIDRLIMLATGSEQISQVLSFDFSNS